MAGKGGGRKKSTAAGGGRGGRSSPRRSSGKTSQAEKDILPSAPDEEESEPISSTAGRCTGSAAAASKTAGGGARKGKKTTTAAAATTAGTRGRSTSPTRDRRSATATATAAAAAAAAAAIRSAVKQGDDNKQEKEVEEEDDIADMIENDAEEPAAEADVVEEVIPKKRRGRPPGSTKTKKKATATKSGKKSAKNIKEEDEEEDEEEKDEGGQSRSDAATGKKKRGRPPGSTKTKKESTPKKKSASKKIKEEDDDNDDNEAEATSTVSAKRGRSKGRVAKSTAAKMPSTTSSSRSSSSRSSPRRGARSASLSSRRAAKKSYSEQAADEELEEMLVLSSSSDNEDEGEEEEKNSSNRSSKKRKRSKTSSSSSSKKSTDDKEEASPKKKRGRSSKSAKKKATATASSSSSAGAACTCPHCDKSFKTQAGLDYHLKQNVCQNGKLTPRARAKKNPWGPGGGKYGPKEARTCPYCNRVFSIVSGLAYHIEHKVCRRTNEKGKGGVKGGANKKKHKRVPLDVQRVAGTAPYPKLQEGERFVTQFGIVEVVADDRIPDDYGKTKVGGYDATKVKGGVDDDKLAELSRAVARYKKRKYTVGTQTRSRWGKMVRANVRKRRRLGRHYAKEAGIDHEESTSSSAAAAAAAQPQSTQIVVWRESVKNPKLTPDAILNHDASYKALRGDVAGVTSGICQHVAGITFEGKGSGIKIEQDDDGDDEGRKAAPAAAVSNPMPRDPLVPLDSYPDRIVTCRLITDKRKRIYDFNDPDAALKNTSASSSGTMESAWDVVRKAQEEVKREKKKKAEEKLKGGSGKGRKQKGKKKSNKAADEAKDSEPPTKTEEDQAMEDEEERQQQNPIISKLCLRRCLLTVPYNLAIPLFICRDCGKTFDSRDGFKDHVVSRVCFPPEPESDDDEEEVEEEEVVEARTPTVLQGSGIKLRARRSRKRKAYVEVGSDDEGGDGADDDDEWDAANAADAQEEEDDDVISVVSEKEDEAPAEPEEVDDDPDVLVVEALPESLSKKKPKKKRRLSLASASSAKSKGRRGYSVKHHRMSAFEDFDPDDDSSVEVVSPNRSRRTPVKDKYGLDPNRRLSRKEWKLLKRPGWMVFKPAASCWYPEIMKTLGIKRGSNNMNWKRLKQNTKRFEPVRNIRNERRAKKKLGNGPIYPDVMANLNLWEGLANKGMYANVWENLGFKKGRFNQSMRHNRERNPPALNICGDEDKNYERIDRYRERMARLEREATSRAVREAKEKKKKKRKRKSGSASNKKKKPPTPSNDPASRNFTINAFKTPEGPLIDMNVLIEEVDAGRFPSMKRYEADHLDVCEICMEDDEDEDRGSIYECGFCSNAEHFSCLLGKYNIHDWDDDDEFMCHSCLATCLHRRHRAERRRLGKADSKPAVDIGQVDDDHDDAFAAAMDLDDGVNDDNMDLEMPPLAASGDGGGDDDNIDLEMPPLAVPDVAAMIQPDDVGEATTYEATDGIAHASASSAPGAAPPAAAAAAASAVSTSQGGDIDLSQSSVQTRASCPEGGPGGLVCCQHCATSYSRILSSTTKEMESQTVAKVGKEVGELMELLRDAQTRLRLAVDVSKENSIRRRTLDM